ncbi:type VII toxin-antitoxin system HepT family RNase toxin [Deferrisoma camini]|uniref:type VII toxin-antitoxin system HepT family RNase toxin n=1 Tax=Deferrisoma camini TaxID=1035120 RepID=UPI00046D707B|nr:DUF86 domain-containing protein [Deferrisoma camini]
MVDVALAHRLLALIEGYLGDLTVLGDLTFEEYRDDVRTRRFAERTLQIAIEACLDLGQHILADEGWGEPQTNREVFRLLTKHGVLDEDLGRRIEPMAGFRNLIVHNYGDIDDFLVYGILRDRVGDIQRFCRAVRRFLERGEER